MAETVKVKGYRELVKALRDMDKAAAKEIRDELRDVGRRVQVTASALFAPVSPVSAAGYKVRVRQRGVAVEQSLRRTTGQHPEYGAEQMRTALLPALGQHEQDVIEGLEHVLDTVARRHGF